MPRRAIGARAFWLWRSVDAVQALWPSAWGGRMFHTWRRDHQPAAACRLCTIKPQSGLGEKQICAHPLA
eukprot:363815-Chlamydomonas_euryale.AAC.3